MYMVLKVRESIDITIMGSSSPMELKWWYGMIGAVPVFDRYEDALDYADNNHELIMEVYFKQKEINETVEFDSTHD